ncbi:MAG: penicillin-binding transpeptidase domain-containing protein [Acidimicrobiales bacterium]
MVDGAIRDTGTYRFSGCRDDFEAADTCDFSSPFKGDATYRLPQALTESSDVFFYTLGGEGFWKEPVQGPEGDEGIQAEARLLGLGASTGVQLPSERTGAVPDRAYFDKKAAEGVFGRDGSQWFGGDTIQLAIGQGQLLVTPIQLANLYATLGNGGTLHQINVVERIEHPDGTVLEFGPRVLRTIEASPAHLAQIEQGLVGVTKNSRGTAYSAFSGFPLTTWPVAGKTGTAQVKGKADTSIFAAYGPTDDPDVGVVAEPTIAISVVLEESGFGSAAAAPIVRNILEPYATKTLPRAVPLDESTSLGQTTTPTEEAP